MTLKSKPHAQAIARLALLTLMAVPTTTIYATGMLTTIQAHTATATMARTNAARRYRIEGAGSTRYKSLGARSNKKPAGDVA